MLKQILSTAAVFAVASAAQAAVMTASDGARVNQSNSTVNYGSDIYIGGWDNGPDQVGVWTFQLPSLGAQANPFLTATFSLDVVSTQNNNSYGTQFQDLVGLTASGVPMFAASTVQGSYGTEPAGLLQAAITQYTDHTELGTYSTSSSQLLSYLNDAYAGGVGAGQYVAIRLQDTGGLMWYKGYSVANSTTIEYTAVPEPATIGVVGMAVSGLMLRRRRA